MSVRSGMADTMRTDWVAIPDLAGVRVIATQRALDEPSKPTALITSRFLTKSPNLPNSYRHVGLMLTLISPHTDLDKAQDQLDVIAEASLDYLEVQPHVLDIDPATTVGWDSSRLAFEIPFTVLAKKAE